MPVLRKQFIASVLVARRNLLYHCTFLLVKASLASICDSRFCSPQQTAMPALRKHSPCLCTHVLHFAKPVFFVESDCLAVNSNMEHVARCRHLLHCPRSTNLLSFAQSFATPALLRSAFAGNSSFVHRLYSARSSRALSLNARSYRRALR